MAAIIRVKRLLEDEPVDALVLNCKRRKLDTDAKEPSESELSTVWKFAGTLNSQEDDIFKHLKKPTKEEAKEQYKKHLFNVSEKVRLQVKNASRESRLKVVNCLRSNQVNQENDEATSNDSVTIVDVESNNIEQAASDEETDKPKYVYDLYYTNCDDFKELDIAEFASVHPLSDDLIYGSKRDNGIASDSEDSDDSNAENNWRNDYPDESEMDEDSISEDDMLKAMNDVDLNDRFELSSDDGEEGFIYSIDSEAAGFEEDIDPTDVRRYGEMYARFKARHKSEDDSKLNGSLYYGDIDEEEYYY